MIRFECPKCAARFSAKDDDAGKRTKCTQCGAPVAVPRVKCDVDRKPPVPPPAKCTTIKCPACAEEIQSEAKKCRFCGESLTDALKMGYPAFYEGVARDGLAWDNLLWDYGYFLFPDDSINDCALSAMNPIGCLFQSQKEPERSVTYEKCQQLIRAMERRLKDLDVASQGSDSKRNRQRAQERTLLRASERFLRITREYALPPPRNNLIDDPANLQGSVSALEELRDSLGDLPPDARRGLEEAIEHAIDTCEGRLESLRDGAVSAASRGPNPEEAAQTGDVGDARGQQRGRLISQIIINGLFMIPYIVGLSHERQGHLPPWTVICMLIWGFVGFNWLLKSLGTLMRRTPSGQAWLARYSHTSGWALLIGGLLCAPLGFLIIPLLIIFELIQLVVVWKKASRRSR